MATICPTTINHGNVSKEIARGLLALQARIKAAKIPPSMLDETLNIATWNIREFGKKRRLEASLHYVAEILGQFDRITVVELRDNLEDMARVMQILGPYWRLIYNDCIADPGGNPERVGFLYDKRVRPTRLRFERGTLTLSLSACTCDGVTAWLRGAGRYSSSPTGWPSGTRTSSARTRTSS